MKCQKLSLMILIGSFVFFSLFSASSVFGQVPCDADADGFVDVGDYTYLVAYLFNDGPPPPNRTDADCDNCPGISVGDALQIIGVAMHGEQGFPPVGTDPVMPSEIEIITPWVDGDLGQIVTKDIKINTVDQPDLYGLIIPLSYQNLPDQTELDFINVDFTGTLLEGMGAGYYADEVNGKVVIVVYQASFVVIPAGSEGTIAHITFEVLAEGDPTKLRATNYPPENTMLLISNPYFEAGDPAGRILLPKFELNVGCDANGDGEVTIADVVYLISFMFRNGPPPLDF